MDYSNLKTLIEFLRTEGVTHYRTEAVELTLGPRPVVVVDSEDDRQVAEEPKIRKDGLTPDEQISLYGRTMR